MPSSKAQVNLWCLCGGRPAALAGARCEALHSRSVTSAYHRPVRLGTLAWYLVPFIDAN